MADPRDQRAADAAADKEFERRHALDDKAAAGAGRPAEPRGWIDKAKDEVAAVLGDPGALSRRQRDGAAGDHSGQGPTTHGDPDALIVAEISQRLTADAELDASRIEVHCLAGAVTLNGSVITSADRRRAEDLAAAVKGVGRVRNDLQIA